MLRSLVRTAVALPQRTWAATAVARPLTTTTSRFMSSMSEHGANTEAASHEEANHYETLSGFQLKPTSPSYFTTQPVYNDLLVELDTLYRQHRPTSKLIKDAGSVRPNWFGREGMTAAVGVQSLKSSQYRLVVSKLNQLAALTPRSPRVEQLLARFTKSEDQMGQKAKPRFVDQYGRALATGRRKEASASVYVVEGEGQMLVNGLDAASYFNKAQDREALLKPFQATSLVGKFNVWARVQGGGTTGQAEAISLGIAKALLTHDPELKSTLRQAGCVTRDPRAVERKKPGQYKARKKFQWVKR
ncbi:37S ribosomal protein S9, mitochondrial [Actinomortierella ambigua]|uniref:Small ribosomal subunit protein uS9m n=1 Tax=Actinomortierella ambigua TaxID=1343610 RepID=A0A9P6U449_9FUNG|nr:37S ribosomal protein S9, mitochondrial [Actinomortierella ambigua]KAG0258461.1 37S ribosomal protein S9, mitochondrial [Actinomortierella ambigua]